VKKTADGRAKVVCGGTFGGSVEQMAEFVNEMGAIADAVVVLACQMAKQEEGEDVWKENVQKLLDLTPGIPLGLYEVPFYVNTNSIQS
jgi:4-hydroxy-tetrahydrodipicolinate synthase